MMRCISVFLFVCISILSINAHSGKARFHVLIDTDGAADDLRAICMLLGNREVEVLSITASEGALTPNQAMIKVTALLRQFYHEGIPVAAGRELKKKAPDWRSQSEQIDWGNEKDIDPAGKPARDLITQTIEQEEEKVIMICLGTLTNLHDALAERPQLKDRIDKVIWYTASARPVSGTNYDTDKTSADKVLASGIPVEVISVKDQAVVIDESYIKMIDPIDQVYARKIVSTHRSGVLSPIVAFGHMKAWDDLTVVWLFAPELFVSAKESPTVTSHILSGTQLIEQAKNTIVQILTGEPDSENRVFYAFPEEPDLYADDVALVMKDIIKKHGRSEWRAGVLTNELHGHLGIYAIIGTKMGIRVREYLNIGVDDVRILTYAGSIPPVSCMNDGLQVSTGGTIGHGLITVSGDSSIRPEATFSFKGKTVRMKLKPQYAAQIRENVAEGIRLHGDLTEEYWLFIRALAIRYWKDFDRHEMFEMTVE